MRLFPNDQIYPNAIDRWGFPTVWVPFGKKGDVVFPDRVKVISHEELFLQESLNTLAGKPVYFFHPGEVNPRNFKDFPLVGTTMDVYRESLDGLGGEILVRVSDLSMFEKIRAGEITEASPGYSDDAGYRDYNHFALVPPGYARGGGKMHLSLESLETPYEILKGITVNDNTNKGQMEKELGQIVAQNQLILEAMEKLNTSMEGMKTPEAVEEVIDMESAEVKEKLYQEAFNEGLIAGQVISEAKSHGYEGADSVEAKTYIIAKAFPSISLESRSPEFLGGMYTGALQSLSKKAEEPTSPVSTPAATIIQESNPKKSISRIPNGQQ